VVVAVLYLLTSASQLHQFPREAFGDEGLPALAAFHAASGLASLGTAIATWRRSRFAWLLSLLWGAITSALVLSLPRLLRLSEEESRGMPIGALIITALAVIGAWYLHRAFARER
jgi:hypothetical protein